MIPGRRSLVIKSLIRVHYEKQSLQKGVQPGGNFLYNLPDVFAV